MNDRIHPGWERHLSSGSPGKAINSTKIFLGGWRAYNVTLLSKYGGTSAESFVTMDKKTVCESAD